MLFHLVQNSFGCCWLFQRCCWLFWFVVGYFRCVQYVQVFKRVQVYFKLLKSAVVCCNFLQGLRLLFSRVHWLWVVLGCFWMCLVVLGRS